MTAERLTKLVAEFKEGYQIPSYVSDNQIKVLANESYQYMIGQNPLFDVEEDTVGISLMKDRMFYAYNHQVMDFNEDYMADILSWKFNMMGSGEDE